MKDNYIFIHNTIIDWISKAESKANIILGIKLFILGYFIESYNSPSSFSYHALLYVLYLFFAGISFYFLIKIIFPQLSTKEPESLIYFKHIDVKYKFNKKQGISDFINFDEDKFKKDIINQILSLSFVSSIKYKLLQKGFFFFGLEVLFILIFRYI